MIIHPDFSAFYTRPLHDVKLILSLQCFSMLMTEACVKPDMVLKYFGTPESPGAHIPFNFLLLTHFREQTNARGLNNTVAGYLGSLKPDQMPNWVVSF